MIVLFTTARSKYPQYRRDFLNACCKPEGAVIPFTYERRWVAVSVWENHPKERGETCLIVYVERPGEGTVLSVARPGQALRYHPVRCATIATSERHQPYLTLTLRLGAFPDYGKIGHDQGLLERFQEWVVSNEDNPERDERVGKGILVRRDSASILGPDSQTSDDWIPLVTHLGRVQGLREATFCTVLPETNDIRPSALLSKEYDDEGLGHRAMPSGGNVDVRLHVTRGPDAEEIAPVVTVEPERATVIPRYPQQRAGGTQYGYRVAFGTVFRDVETPLSVSFPSDSKARVQGPEFHVHVTLLARKKTLYLAVILIAIGPFLSSFEIDWILGVDTQGQAKPATGLQQAVFWLSRSLGVAVTGIGAWLGLTKIVSRENL